MYGLQVTPQVIIGSADFVERETPLYMNLQARFS
jgi:hypothetical protein